MDIEDLMKLGFKKIPGVIPMFEKYNFVLTMDRRISVCNINTGNELMWLCSVEKSGSISDAVCIHNYDINGELTIDKVKGFVELLKSKNDEMD